MSQYIYEKADALEGQNALLAADNATLRTALHTQAEESAKLIEQRDELLNACRRSVIAIAAACEFRPEFLGDYKALSAAINKATNTTN